MAIAGVNHSGIIGAALAVGSMFGAWLVGGKLDSMAQAHGDVPAVPAEMRGETTRKGAGGGGCAKAGRLGESHSQVQSNRTGQVAK